MKTLTRLLLFAASATAATAIAAAVAPQNAAEQFDMLQGELRRSHTSGDSASYLNTAVALRALLNGSPDSTLQLMAAQAMAGAQGDALQSFEQFVAMGQANDAALQGKQFEALRNLEKYRRIDADMAANTAPVGLATELFRLKPAGQIPEDIDYDAAAGFFYITTALGQQILAVDMAGVSRVFAESPDHWPMMAIKIDSRRHIAWATEVAIDGFASVPAADWGRSAILMYDTSSGRLLHRIEGPQRTALGDMTLDRNGDAIVSDGDHGGLYRVSRASLRVERLDAGDFISPQTPAVLADGRHILVPDYVRGLGVLDLATKRVAWIPMEGLHALSGIDGLYLNGPELIVTQNGTSPPRVIRFNLDRSRTRVVNESIIEHSTPTLRVPTHGVLIGDRFYYIANSGWDSLDEHGTAKPSPALTETIIMRAEL
jgi:hypothetical protein